MTTRNSRSWRSFLYNLLTSSTASNGTSESSFDGVCFFTLSGRVEYRDGCFCASSSLPGFLDVDPLQFFALFDQLTRQAVQGERRIESLTPALRLGPNVFHVVLATFSSVCAVTSGKTHGLVVEKLPFGVLVVAFSAPVRLEMVFSRLDDACAALRH